MNIKKFLLSFYLICFGLNGIIAIIAPIYSMIYESLYYLIALILTLTLIGVYIFTFYRKIERIRLFSHIFVIYGMINLLMLIEHWPFWLTMTIGILDLVALLMFYFTFNRRKYKF